LPDPLDSLSLRVVPHTILSPVVGWTVLGGRYIGGPDDPADRRMVLSAAELRSLLKMAEATPSGRVVLHHVGLTTKLMHPNDKPEQRVEFVTLTSSGAKPERVL